MYIILLLSQVWCAYTHIQYTQYSTQYTQCSLCGHCTTSDVYTCSRGVPAVMCCLYIRLELWRVSQHAVDSLRHPPRLLLQGGGRWPGPSSEGAPCQETHQHPPRHRAGERVRPDYTGIVTLNVIVSRHIKDQVKEAYLDTSAMDDQQLLMQFFKKRDTDNNMKLDGLELLRALVDMEGKNKFTGIQEKVLSSLYLQRMKITITTV